MSQITRTLFVIAGSLCLALGVIGLFLPIMPTVPFLLLASACYMRGSRRMHAWLLAQPHFGHYIRDYEAGRGVPMRAKAFGIGMLWVSIFVSAYFFAKDAWLRAVLFAVAVAVTIYLLRLPTLKTARG
jgi:uncharacterized membrane protein YbaN (DUF454 family)